MVKRINSIFKLLFFAFLAANVVFLFYEPSLPAPSELLPEIKNEPMQKEVEEEDIELRAEGHNYTLDPKYSYELYGLVVSLYDSDSLIDITHKNDPKNVRDLCVIWGENALSNGYREVNYRSGEFTCFWRWRGEKPDFNTRHISNNHILPMSPAISDKVRDVNIGDQIYIQGKLVDYTVELPDGTVVGKRATSTNRQDTGNGACEVIYVEDIEILKRGNAWFYSAKDIAKRGIWYLLAAWILFNIIMSQVKKQKKKEGL